MAIRDDFEPAATHVPGLPCVTPHGAGSASGWQYTPALGQAIAEQYAESAAGGLWELRALAPDRIPPPAIVRAWCRQFPAFGLLMKEAEKIRAEQFAEQSVVIADTMPMNTPPARVALMVSARQHLAGKLDPARYGKEGATNGHLPALSGDQPTAIDMDDNTLLRIAAGALGEQADGGTGAG